MEGDFVIKKGAERILDIYSRYPEFDNLTEIADAVSKFQDTLTPDELSRALVKMGVLLVRIGPLAAELAARANEAYIYRKKRYLWEFSQITGELTVKDRENRAMVNIYKEQEAELVTRFVADHIGALYEDFSRLCNIIQSRLRSLRDERINVSNQV